MKRPKIIGMESSNVTKYFRIPIPISGLMVVAWDDRMLDCDVYIPWHFFKRMGQGAIHVLQKFTYTLWDVSIYMVVIYCKSQIIINYWVYVQWPFIALLHLSHSRLSAGCVQPPSTGQLRGSAGGAGHAGSWR